MAYSPENLRITNCDRKMRRRFPGWAVLGNIPNFAWVVVYHEKLKIVTQTYDKNFDLGTFQDDKLYHPRYSLAELKILIKGAPTIVPDSLGIEEVETIPPGERMRRAFDKYVLPRLIEERNRIDGILGTKKSR